MPLTVSPLERLVVVDAVTADDHPFDRDDLKRTFWHFIVDYRIHGIPIKFWTDICICKQTGAYEVNTGRMDGAASLCLLLLRMSTITKGNVATTLTSAKNTKGKRRKGGKKSVRSCKKQRKNKRTAKNTTAEADEPKRRKALIAAIERMRSNLGNVIVSHACYLCHKSRQPFRSNELDWSPRVPADPFLTGV